MPYNHLLQKQYITTVLLIQLSAYKILKDEVEGFSTLSTLEKAKRVLDKAFNDPDKFSGKVFKNLSSGAKAFGESIKATHNPIKAFNAGLSAMSTTAKAALGATAAIAVVVGAIKLADHILDKSNDSTDELLKKKDNITKNLSEVNSELENIDNQIAELNKQKLNITDSNDISALNSQIELLQQRKELLEWKAQNDRKENENNANDIIESIKNNSTYLRYIFDCLIIV